MLWSGPAKRAIAKELPESAAAAALELILVYRCGNTADLPPTGLKVVDTLASMGSDPGHWGSQGGS